MIEKYVSNTLIYKEFSNEQNKKYFDLSTRKFLHNIDSLYFSVLVDADWNNDFGCKRLVNFLKEKKNKRCESFEAIPIDFFGDDFIMNGIGDSIYQFDVERTEHYVIFFMNNCLKEGTPQIWVHIRSQLLWLEGEYKAVDKAINDVEMILNKFSINILEIKENRIDFAYHTNYIQDPLNFFKEDKLNAMQVSHFKRASKEYTMIGEWDVDCDYVTFGRKKSNNLFFRIYNKTKEIIEKSKKEFFNHIWLDNKLINKFDFYCNDRCFERGSYKYLDIARLEFYAEFGSDLNYKDKCNKLINANNFDYDSIKKLADFLTPKITLVMNIEFETRRKFYRTLDESVDVLLKCKSDCKPYAQKLYVKLDNKKLFTDYLTTHVIRFIDLKFINKNGQSITRKKNCPNAKWWDRLRECKVNKKYNSDEDVKLVRAYQKNVDVNIIKKKLINNVSTYSLYLNNMDLDKNLFDDALDFIGAINENDINDAISYKKRKFPTVKNRTTGQVNTDAKRSYSLVDNETGELI